LYILRLFYCKKRNSNYKIPNSILINHQIFIEDTSRFGILSFNFLFSSVAGAAVSAAGAAVQLYLLLVASVSLSEPLSESPSITAAVTKDKILSIDLEASSFDGITYSTSRGSELVSTIAKECLIFELLLLRCVPL
jgi:hypothetical protein